MTYITTHSLIILSACTLLFSQSSAAVSGSEKLVGVTKPPTRVDPALRADGRFDFLNFHNRPHLNLAGDVQKVAGRLVLTDPRPNTAGAIWFNQPFDLSASWVTSFSFTIRGVNSASEDGGAAFAFVAQREGAYVLGEKRSGSGYAGLDGAFAVEFDMLKDKKTSDPDANHISVHPGPYNGGPLSSKDSSVPSSESSSGDISAGSLPTVFPSSKVPDFRKMKGETLVTLVYRHSSKRLHITIKSVEPNAPLHATFEAPLNLRPGAKGNGAGKVYIGFTAVTGQTAYATIALQSWSFRKDGVSYCQDGFKQSAGGQCIVTNKEAMHECPRRSTCEQCVEDVYNCVWCDEKCVVGTADGVRDCDALMMEPLACGASLSRVWLYMLMLGLVVVVVFGVVLFRMLPPIQSFRAISVLVALVGGALFGMAISFMTSVSLVEITETPFFSIAFGAFFLLEAVLILQHVRSDELPDRGWDKHVIMLTFSAIWLAITGVLCFVVEKRWVHWLSPSTKILFYSVLGSSLNFALVMSMYDIFAEVRTQCFSSHHVRDRVHGQNSSHLKLATNTVRVALLAVSSFLSGLCKLFSSPLHFLNPFTISSLFFSPICRLWLHVRIVSNRRRIAVSREPSARARIGIYISSRCRNRSCIIHAAPNRPAAFGIRRAD